MKPVLEKYPRLTVVGAHFGGWSVWKDAVEILPQYQNFYVECSSSLYAMSADEAKALILAYGADRVLFGTDYPMWEIETELDRFFQIDLSEEDREKILYKNAEKLFLKQ